MAYTVTFAWEDDEQEDDEKDTLNYDKYEFDSYDVAVSAYFTHLIANELPEIYRDGEPIENEVLYDEDLFKKCFYDDKDLLALLHWDTVPYEDLWKQVLDYRRMVALCKKFS